MCLEYILEAVFNVSARVLKPGLAQRVDPRTGRPGPGTGPGGGKNSPRSWPGETRSTPVNPGVARLCFLIYI